MLHVSSRGEAKYPRGPSGQGASRPRRQRGFMFFTKHEKRITRRGIFASHETRTLRPFGSPWVRKGRTTRNPHPDRRLVNSFLPRWPSMTPNIPQKCTKSRIPQKNRCLPARFCPRWPDVARWVGVSRCPRTVSASRPASRRAPFAGNPTKMHKIPDPAEKCEKRALRRSSRSPAGRSRCVECRMNPCCESKGNVR